MLPRKSGTSSLPDQVFEPFDVLPRAPITIGIVVTFEAPWIILISNASSWYFSTFSSSVLMMLWSASTAMSISAHFCVSLCTRIISGRLCFSHVLGNPHFSIFCSWQGLMVIPLVIRLDPILPAHLPVYPLSYTLSRQACCIHWQCVVLFQWHLHTIYTGVTSQLLQGLTWLETTLTLNKRTNNRNNGP